MYTTKKREAKSLLLVWEQRESNPRPSACKADALNQLSYAPVKELFPEWDCKYRHFFFTSNIFGQKFVYICSPFHEGLFFLLARAGQWGCFGFDSI